VLQRQSKVLAAITATMPLNVALGLWIVSAASDGDQQAVAQFTGGMLVSIVQIDETFQVSKTWKVFSLVTYREVHGARTRTAISPNG